MQEVVGIVVDLYDILKAVFFLAAPLGWIVGGKYVIQG